MSGYTPAAGTRTSTYTGTGGNISDFKFWFTKNLRCDKDYKYLFIILVKIYNKNKHFSNISSKILCQKYYHSNITLLKLNKETD